MSLNQRYNKTITFKPSVQKEDTQFDLCYLTYNGRLTKIVDYFNKLPVSKSKEIVSKSFDEETRRNSLQISSFLNFANIFLYLLTYDADAYYSDVNGQSTFHMISYRGHTKLLALLLNHERYKMKMKSLERVDSIKKSSGFSKLDIVKGKQSRAVHHTPLNVQKFADMQKALRDEAKRLIKEFIDKLGEALTKKDKEGQTPLHLAAMSKFPLSHLICYNILDFDFFKFDSTWDDYLNLYEDLQALEIKQERMCDPRRSLRLEREFVTLLGDQVIKEELSPYFNTLKKELLKKVINMQDNNGDSILHISAFHGDFRIVNKLVFFGGDKKMMNGENKLPVDLAKDNFVRKVLTNLNKAAKSSDSKNITELVNFGQDINEKISIFSQAPIHKIIESKKEDKHNVLKKMLEMGADPNIKDSNGWSALHYACQLGDLDSVKILIAAHADIDSYSNNKRIPLHLAANMNYPEIVNYLLDNNANADYKDDQGCTPMHLAAKQGNTKCIEHLLFHNADLYAIDFRGWNILHYAAFHGHKKTVRYLAKYDADNDILCTMRNSQNKLPIEIVRDPSVKPFFISLWHAAKDGDLDMTRNLLNSGEDINKKSQFENNSPLHIAVINNHYLLVRLLIEQGATVNVDNKDGHQPWEYAGEMRKGIAERYKASEDKNRDTIDLRDVVNEAFERMRIKKKEEYVDATIGKENWRLRVWNAFDFNEKICKVLKVDEKEEEKQEEEKKKTNLNTEEKKEEEKKEQIQ